MWSSKTVQLIKSGFNRKNITAHFNITPHAIIISAYKAVINLDLAVNIMMNWIHAHPKWPNFTWNADSLASQLAKIRYRQGRLLGRMENLGFTLKNEANLNMLTNDVVKSSAIEGERLNPDEVRSSIARISVLILLG